MGLLEISFHKHVSAFKDILGNKLSDQIVFNDDFNSFKNIYFVLFLSEKNII